MVVKMNNNLVKKKNGEVEIKEFNIRDLRLTTISILRTFCSSVDYDPNTHIGKYNGKDYVIELIQDTNNIGEENNKRLQGNIIGIAIDNQMDAVALYPICDESFKLISLIFIKWDYEVIKGLDSKKNAGVKVKLDDIKKCLDSGRKTVGTTLLYESEITCDLFY